STPAPRWISASRSSTSSSSRAGTTGLPASPSASPSASSSPRNRRAASKRPPRDDLTNTRRVTMTATAVTYGTDFDFGIEELDELVDPDFCDWLIGVGAGLVVGGIVVLVAT